MKSSAAFTTIILIWSTTPLGIAWSNDTLHPSMAVMLRMALAALLGVLLLRVLRIRLYWHAAARRTYACSLMGIYGAMFCTYSGAQYIPSGWISILFSLAPVTSNLFARGILGQVDFDRWRWCAFVLSFAGLLVICLDDLVLQEEGWKGIALILVAVTLYSLSGVLVQRENFQAHPLSITVGSLLWCLPFFVVSWWLADGKAPELDWSSTSPWAVLYLAVMGSLLGFACYFYVLRHKGATAVAMVTLMTPVLALWLGHWLNDEAVSLHILVGSALVLLGLAMYYRIGWQLFARRPAMAISPGPVREAD